MKIENMKIEATRGQKCRSMLLFTSVHKCIYYFHWFLSSINIQICTRFCH